MKHRNQTQIEIQLRGLTMTQGTSDKSDLSLADGSRWRLWLPVVMMVVLLAAAWQKTHAQVDLGLWSEPINLSQTGGTDEPVMVADSGGTVHVLWQDLLEGFVYTRGDGRQWSAPQAIRPPFGRAVQQAEGASRAPATPHSPTLVAGAENAIHALWADDSGALFHSSVAADRFTSEVAWSPPQQLSEAATGWTVTAEADGQLHVAYARSRDSLDLSAGIYYRSSVDGGQTWMTPTVLYESPYLRTVSVGEVDVDIMSHENLLTVAWDDPSLERVYMARSTNSGSDWSEAEQVDGREPSDGLDARRPTSLRLVVQGDLLIRIWRAGHLSVDCALFQQVSQDNGRSWTTREPILTAMNGCPEAVELRPVDDENLLLVAYLAEQAYLAAWRDGQWGEPQTQPALQTIIDPRTYRPVDLGCRQSVVVQGEQQTSVLLLLVVGCDRTSQLDIWLRSRTATSLLRTLAPEGSDLWQIAELRELDDSPATQLSLVAGANDIAHAIWIEYDSVAASSSGQALYARRDGESWTAPQAILGNSVSRLTVIPFSNGNNLAAAWVDAVSGNLLVSQASGSNAQAATEWSPAVSIPIMGAAVHRPELVESPDGILRLLYSVSLNEGRGVYLSESADGGLTWSEGRPVFDAAAAGWTMVGASALAESDPGGLHAIWTQEQAPPSEETVALYYSASPDGISWEAPTRLAAGDLIWADILAGRGRAIHMLYQTADATVWHRYSSDEGATWTQTQALSASANGPKPVAATIDRGGDLHLLYIEPYGPMVGRGQLVYWRWSEMVWEQIDVTVLEAMAVSEMRAATLNDSLGLFMAATQSQGLESGESRRRQLLRVFDRELTLPEVQPTPLPTQTPLPTVNSTVTPTPQASATPTTAFPTDFEAEGQLPLPIDRGSPLTGPLLGIIPAAIVVLLAFFIGIRMLRGDRR